jgi:hypothetical protein
LAEALACQPFDKPPEPEAAKVKPDELSLIIAFLEQHHMIVDRPTLIEVYHRGLTLVRAKEIYHHHQARYTAYMKKIRQPKASKAAALFYAFILDCQKAINTNPVATYASHGDLS